MIFLKACVKIFLLILITLVVIPLQSLVLFFHTGKYSYIIPRIWHYLACKIFSVRLNIEGQPHTSTQTIYMSNHLSYFDIPALGSILTGAFVAKRDVAGWPVFGYLAKLQQTYFIDRSRSAIGSAKSDIEKRLEKDESLIIFPEGTSTSGLDVLPFKSSLFSLAYGPGRDNLHIQPISILLKNVDGQEPHTKEEHDIYAWPRDMDTELHHHLWRFAKTSGAVLQIIFHPPLKASAFSNRKLLTQACYERVQCAFDNKLKNKKPGTITENAA